MVPPDGGSRILFFSGGTALAPVAAELSRHTRNAVHVITTFDSGGSSAELRRAFDMPAVGDIRARIMALADRSLEGNPETVELLGYRLPKDAGPEALHRELASLASGAHPLVAAIPEPMNEVVTQHLSAFRSLMPVDMDLAGASIGNLLLTSGYLSLDRQLEPVVRVFSGMVQARGVVMPVADSCAHLCVRLENGEVIVGQHRFTGKTATSITSPILDMWLSASLDDPSPVSVPIQPRLAHVIRTAYLLSCGQFLFFRDGEPASPRRKLCRPRGRLPEGVHSQSRHGPGAFRAHGAGSGGVSAAFRSRRLPGGAGAQLASCGRGRVPLSRRHPLRVACPARHPCPQGASCFRASLSRRGLAVPRAFG